MSGGGIRIRVRIVGLILGVGAGARRGRDEAIEGLVITLFFVAVGEVNRSGHRWRGYELGIFISSGQEMKMPLHFMGPKEKVPVSPPSLLRFPVLSRRPILKKEKGKKKKGSERQRETTCGRETDQTKHDVGIAEIRSDDGRKRESVWRGTKPYACILGGGGWGCVEYVLVVELGVWRFAFPFLIPTSSSLSLALQANGELGGGLQRFGGVENESGKGSRRDASERVLPAIGRLLILSRRGSYRSFPFPSFFFFVPLMRERVLQRLKERLRQEDSKRSIDKLSWAVKNGGF